MKMSPSLQETKKNSRLFKIDAVDGNRSNNNNRRPFLHSGAGYISQHNKITPPLQPPAIRKAKLLLITFNFLTKLGNITDDYAAVISKWISESKHTPKMARKKQ